MPAQDPPGLIDKYQTIIFALIFFAVGTGLLVYGFATDPAHSSNPHPILSFLAQQFGTIFVFTGVYTVISDYFVRKNFEKQIQQALDFVRLDQSIKDFGISQIKPKFVLEDMIQNIQQASSVQMLILRNNSFFEGNYTRLKERIQDGDFSLKVVLPNPGNVALISLLARKFSNLSRPQELADSIVSVVNVWLKNQIYDQLTPAQQSRLSVILVNKYPLYSAYLFDRKQFWYVPYQYRNDRQELPVFIFEAGFDRAEVYKDFAALVSEGISHDLSKPLTIPAFPT